MSRRERRRNDGGPSQSRERGRAKRIWMKVLVPMRRWMTEVSIVWIVASQCIGPWSDVARVELGTLKTQRNL